MCLPALFGACADGGCPTYFNVLMIVETIFEIGVGVVGSFGSQAILTVPGGVAEIGFQLPTTLRYCARGIGFGGAISANGGGLCTLGKRIERATSKQRGRKELQIFFHGRSSSVVRARRLGGRSDEVLKGFQHKRKSRK
jgi:hypothetical protein